MGKKYIIELPENTHWIQWIMEGTKDHHPYMDYKQVEDLTPYTEPDLERVRKEAYRQGYDTGYGTKVNEFYKQGLIDAWEAARWLVKNNAGVNLKVFGMHFTTDIFCNISASEAIEKIRQYEQEKDRQARIEYNFDEIKDVLETTAKECNVSLDEIAEVMQKMKEADNG